jgi:hypothetical protein
VAPGSIGSAQLASGTAAANLAASGQGGVASGGIVLSEQIDNANLATAGYVRIGGKMDLVAESWTNYASGPAPTGNLNLGRQSHSAVWTGSEMIMWGGYNGSYQNDGARYNPVANTWTLTSRVNAASPRGGHWAVWTGSRMLVWGGDDGGGRYDPATDTWSAMSTNNAPSGGAAAVWSGSTFVVWGDNNNSIPYGSSVTITHAGGGRYNPGTDTWTSITTNNAPLSRFSPAFVWSGTELIVWGGSYDYELGSFLGFSGSGIYQDAPYQDGARYNPVTDHWTTMNTNGSPVMYNFDYATAVWSGSQMILWGATPVFESGYYVDDMIKGARYNPVANTWSTMTTNNAPSLRFGYTSV